MIFADGGKRVSDCHGRRLSAAESLETVSVPVHPQPRPVGDSDASIAVESKCIRRNLADERNYSAAFDHFRPFQYCRQLQVRRKAGCGIPAMALTVL